jgi:hypothetical protein
MNVKVLKSMSEQEIAEFDRLMHNVYDAEFEIEMREGSESGEVLEVELAESKRILEQQKVAFQKFKQLMLERYMVKKFYGVGDKDEI